MKLLSFYADGNLTVGVKTDAGVVDINAAAKTKGKAFDCPCGCGTKFGTESPLTMEAICWCGAAALAYVREMADGSPVIDEAGIQFAPVMPNPEKIMCVGANYACHSKEMGAEPPEIPVLFGKYKTALNCHNGTVVLPPAGEMYDYEAELVVVFGKVAKDVSVEDAMNYVFGYTIGNDVSMRKPLGRMAQWLTRKSPDGFGPVGPYIVLKDELDGGNLPIKLYRNGVLKQDSNSSNLVFDIPTIISYASQYVTFKPGDLLFTGTPAGVIAGSADKDWLKAGEVLEVEIEGIGTLRNVIA